MPIEGNPDRHAESWQVNVVHANGVGFHVESAIDSLSDTEAEIDLAFQALLDALAQGGFTVLGGGTKRVVQNYIVTVSQ